ncbi:hypothetical protein DHEL01_v212829 [Diaporthe helianthi]|uniref:Uncharacterized protein n=1 Tax=Diaporthe helianthi TaxID=158607 RepID=A0A2P5HEV7_DIAHE|nr:hypothetical protein DHEL01_v212829 [Diaporthe helianthi]
MQCNARSIGGGWAESVSGSKGPPPPPPPKDSTDAPSPLEHARLQDGPQVEELAGSLAVEPTTMCLRHADTDECRPDF